MKLQICKSGPSNAEPNEYVALTMEALRKVNQTITKLNQNIPKVNQTRQQNKPEQPPN